MQNAIVITPEGVETVVTPKNGTDFSLKECQASVGGYIETVPTWDGRLMILNEEGKLKGLPRNAKATALFRYDVIVGPVLVCPEEMFK
jgi:hypothetical protein